MTEVLIADNINIKQMLIVDIHTCCAAPPNESSISTVFLAATPFSSVVDFFPYSSKINTPSIGKFDGMYQM